MHRCYIPELRFLVDTFTRIWSFGGQANLSLQAKDSQLIWISSWALPRIYQAQSHLLCHQHKQKHNINISYINICVSKYTKRLLANFTSIFYGGVLLSAAEGFIYLFIYLFGMKFMCMKPQESKLCFHSGADLTALP